MSFFSASAPPLKKSGGAGDATEQDAAGFCRLSVLCLEISVCPRLPKNRLNQLQVGEVRRK